MVLGSEIQFSSLSLGCKAIFLLGGKSRQDLPLAMFLRSGDVVLMAGEARECFHGQFYVYIPVSFKQVTMFSYDLSLQLHLQHLEVCCRILHDQSMIEMISDT